MLGRIAQDDRELLALDPTVADALYRSQAELELERLASELAAAAHDPRACAARARLRRRA